jgi:hypothetical protein
MRKLAMMIREQRILSKANCVLWGVYISWRCISIHFVQGFTRVPSMSRCVYATLADAHHLAVGLHSMRDAIDNMWNVVVDMWGLILCIFR